MGAIIKILIISTTIVVPWVILRVTDLETKIIAALMPLMANEYVIIGFMVLPPLVLSLTQWLFKPRNKTGKQSFGNKSILFRFWG